MKGPHVVHHVPGRLRLKLPRSKGDGGRMHRIQQSLAPLSGIRKVDVNPTTGSVLIHYDPRQRDRIVERVREHARNQGLFSLEVPDVSPLDEFEQKVEIEAEFLSKRSRVAAWIVEAVGDLNDELRRATDNNLDLNVLVPLALGGYSLLHRKKDLSTPLWVTLALSSFNSFVALHARAAAEADGGAPDPPRPRHADRVRD